MNTAQVEALRLILAPSGWLERTRYFARALQGQARTPSGLLIVGTPADEPWHMTAHLADESRLARRPELAPVLVRWNPPPGAPPHLSVGLDRLRQVGRSETLLVVGSDAAPEALLERVADAKKAGTSIFALDRGDGELEDLAHESLAVLPGVDPVSFDGAQHLVSLAVGESAAQTASDSAASEARLRDLPAVLDSNTGLERTAWRGKLARLLDSISGT